VGILAQFAPVRLLTVPACAPQKHRTSRTRERPRRSRPPRRRAPAFREATIRETPLGRSGTVDDIAPLVVFLLSDESSFITRAEIPVDGGLTAHGGVKSISVAMRTEPPGPV